MAAAFFLHGAGLRKIESAQQPDDSACAPDAVTEHGEDAATDLSAWLLVIAPFHDRDLDGYRTWVAAIGLDAVDDVALYRGIERFLVAIRAAENFPQNGRPWRAYGADAIRELAASDARRRALIEEATLVRTGLTCGGRSRLDHHVSRTREMIRNRMFSPSWFTQPVLPPSRVAPGP